VNPDERHGEPSRVQSAKLKAIHFSGSHIVQRLISIGAKTSITSLSPLGEVRVVFEDDGEAAYFYALNAPLLDEKILDLLNIYTVDQISNPEVPRTVRIIWSKDGWRALLTIDAYPHALFDFKERRGYCRTNYPNVRQSENESWQSNDHRWNEDIMEGFR
jgi:hypothetical protein